MAYTKNATPYKTRDKESPVDRLNRLWLEGLDARKWLEPIWLRANRQMKSKSEKTYSGRSNFFLDLTRSQVRTYASQIAMNLTGEAPYVEFDAYGQEDITKVKLAEAVCYYLMTNPKGGFLDEFLNTITSAFVYGFAIQKHTWETYTKKFSYPVPIQDPLTGEITGFDYEHPVEVELQTFEGVYYSGRSPFRVVINPAAYNFTAGRIGWLIEADSRVPVERLLELEEQNRLYGVKKNLDKLAYGWVDLFEGSVDPAEKEFSQRNTKKDGLVFVREMWDENLNTCTIVGNHDVELWHDSNPLLGGIPYTIFSLHNLPDEMPMGIPEQLRYTQEYANMSASLNMDERLRNAFPPVFVQSGLGLKSRLIKVQPNDIIEVPGIPKDSVYAFERPTHQAETWAEIDRMQMWAQRSTGLSLAVEGQQSGEDTTATASSIAASSAQSFIRFMTLLFSAKLGQMAKHNLMTANQFMSSRMIRTSLSNELEPQFEYVSPGSYALEVCPRLRDRSRTASNMETLNQFMAFWDRLQPYMAFNFDPKTMTITPGLCNPQEWIQMGVKLAQFPSWQRLFSKPVEENNPFSQQNIQQLFQQMQGQGMMNPNQPQQVPQGQMFGNQRGQLQSAANPASNGRLGGVLSAGY